MNGGRAAVLDKKNSDEGSLGRVWSILYSFHHSDDYRQKVLFGSYRCGVDALFLISSRVKRLHVWSKQLEFCFTLATRVPFLFSSVMFMATGSYLTGSSSFGFDVFMK